MAGKGIVVTRGGNGVGRQVVLELLRRGAKVAAVDIRADGLDETMALAAAGDRLATFPVDLTDRLIDVNLYGTINAVKAFLPPLLERPVAHLANVSSMGGFLPVPGQTIYGATKVAVRLFTEALYAELLDTDVGVTVVFPGAVRTEITTHSGVEVPSSGASEGSGTRTTAPEGAARIIVDGIEAGRLHVFVGRDARMMNLFNRLMPRRSTHLIQREMRGLLGT
ncbi:MAG: SDR family NAD(P)-dependent oxidoreductase [Nitriliruptoraceae bacterium]